MIDMNFIKPKIIVSKCLGFENCRYDGQIIKNNFIDKLKEHAILIPVCPEVEIGLGVPRNSLRLKKEDNKIRLIQSKNNIDLSKEMTDFAYDFLKNKDITAFILKNRSPSCAITDAKLYHSNNPNPVEKSSGLFTKIAKELYPEAIFEDEGRLTNFKIREHFLTFIYTIAEFKEIQKRTKMKDLVQFQSNYKYLFLSINEVKMRELGKIVANHQKKDKKTVFQEYENILYQLFEKIADKGNNINVLMHAFGYFSKDLSSDEKTFFLEVLDKYRNKKLPLSVPKNILKSWIIKYNEEYLARQKFFNPYPEELIEIKDSGKPL